MVHESTRGQFDFLTMSWIKSVIGHRLARKAHLGLRESDLDHLSSIRTALTFLASAT